VPRTARVPPGYDPASYPPVAVTVDVVVLTIADGALQVLLVIRGEDPYSGMRALPGGFVRPEEDLDRAAARELREETGVEAAAHLEQFGTYGDPGRDPRMRVISVAYLAILRTVETPVGGTDALHAELVPVNRLLGHDEDIPLAFDHRQILTDGVARARDKLRSTSLATAFVGPEFTLSQLRHVYEATWGTRLDPGNFRRKVLSSPDFVEPTGERSPPGPSGGKPAELFRWGRADRLDPPFTEPPER
jgi:8-oxo-dGTP diphosphatase